MAKKQQGLSRWAIYWSGFKSKSPFSMIGFVGIMVAVFVVPPVVFLIDQAVKEPFEKIDLEKVTKVGSLHKAKIAGVRIRNNMRFDNVCPKIVTYEYWHNGTIETGRMQTIEWGKLDSLSHLDSITVVAWNNQSVIKGLQSCTFPTYRFLMGSLVLLAVGLPLTAIGHVAGWRRLRRTRS